jgi:hypothetical protein
MSVSAQDFEATVCLAAAVKARLGIESVLNMTQMTVAEVDLAHTTNFPSDVYVIHLRPTSFHANALFWRFDAKGIQGPFGCRSHEVQPLQLLPMSSQKSA